MVSLVLAVDRAAKNALTIKGMTLVRTRTMFAIIEVWVEIDDDGSNSGNDDDKH